MILKEIKIKSNCTLVVVEDTILNAQEKIIVQQVNCLGRMGAGLALILSQKYPDLYNRYYQHCLKHNFSEELLGKVFLHKVNDSRIIANVFGQYSTSNYFRQTKYNKLSEGFKTLNNWCSENNIKEIAIPYGIGCGLGGGEWREVLHRITKEFINLERIVLYKLKGVKL